MNNKIFLLFGILVIFAAGAFAQVLTSSSSGSGASYVRSSSLNYQSYYGSAAQTYWPILGAQQK